MRSPPCVGPHGSPAHAGRDADVPVAVLRALLQLTPPNTGSRLLELVRHRLGLPREMQRTLHVFLTYGAGGLLDGWTDVLKRRPSTLTRSSVTTPAPACRAPVTSAAPCARPDRRPARRPRRVMTHPPMPVTGIMIPSTLDDSRASVPSAAPARPHGLCSVLPVGTTTDPVHNRVAASPGSRIPALRAKLRSPSTEPLQARAPPRPPRYVAHPRQT